MTDKTATNPPPARIKDESASGSYDILADLRDRIDEKDDAILGLISLRVNTALLLGKAKSERGLPIYDGNRESEVLARIAEGARKRGLNPEYAQRVFREIINLCRAAQGWHETASVIGYTADDSRPFSVDIPLTADKGIDSLREYPDSNTPSVTCCDRIQHNGLDVRALESYSRYI